MNYKRKEKLLIKDNHLHVQDGTQPMDGSHNDVGRELKNMIISWST